MGDFPPIYEFLECSTDYYYKCISFDEYYIFHGYTNYVSNDLIQNITITFDLYVAPIRKFHK